MAVFRVVQRFHGHCNGNARIKAFLLTFIQMRILSESKVFSSGDDTVLPVLIVGAEPVGLVLSLLLTKFGVKCAVLEKTNNFLKHPHAHFINNRSMKFVDEKVQWMHIDLVGPVRNEKKRIVTGFGISILVEWVAKHSEENTVSSLGRMVMVVWLFLLMVITSSYTASLTSILTVKQLSSPITGIDSLIATNSAIGYQVGSSDGNVDIK